MGKKRGGRRIKMRPPQLKKGAKIKSPSRENKKGSREIYTPRGYSKRPSPLRRRVGIEIERRGSGLKIGAAGTQNARGASGGRGARGERKRGGEGSRKKGGGRKKIPPRRNKKGGRKIKRSRQQKTRLVLRGGFGDPPSREPKNRLP